MTGNISYVVFDLETGCLARTSDILQISAVHESKEFNTYVTPTQPISKGASDVTKLTLVNGQQASGYTQCEGCTNWVYGLFENNTEPSTSWAQYKDI